MDETDRMVFAVVSVTVLLLILFAVMAVLMIINASRRHRHRAELAEIRMARDQELRQVEREATAQTLTEIGRELHDNVGQLLTVAQVGLLDHMPPEQHPRVAVSLEALDQGLEEVRRLGRSLDQNKWRSQTLVDGMMKEVDRLDRLGKIEVTFEMNGDPIDPEYDVKIMLFRVFQEIVSNALRHSGATGITITIEGDPDFLLTVTDNGRGFDPAGAREGHGIANLIRRCKLIGYSARLTSGPGMGATWRVTPHGTGTV